MKTRTKEMNVVQSTTYNYKRKLNLEKLLEQRLIKSEKNKNKIPGEWVS